MSKFYVTTPIYYVNDKPHLGHAYTTIIADVFARYYRQKYGDDSVFFLTGTDEHGTKIAQAAAKKGKSPKEFVDEVSEEYKKTWERLNISHDYFFRTTNPSHKKIVQDLLQDLYNKGFIYKGIYKGFYCIGCEKYLTEDEIVDGKCILHPTTILVEQEEENYFFKLKDFSAKVLDKIENDGFKILPEVRKNEISGKIKKGITDVSISRTGVEWGIELPWDKKHTVYVWVDALFNYYSATQIVEGKDKFWPPDLHLMAKDILWFHALVWEALLLACGKELPRAVFAHGFFSIDGQKMSKSVGNIIDPIDLANEYGTDGVRYLLLTSFSVGNDGDISLPKFKEKYNADLANGIGNLVSRLAKLCEKVGLSYEMNLTDLKIETQEIDHEIKQYRPDEALKVIWKDVDQFNKDIQVDQPWKLEGDSLKEALNKYINRLLIIAVKIKPFLPETSVKILTTFNSGKISMPAPLFLRK